MTIFNNYLTSGSLFPLNRIRFKSSLGIRNRSSIASPREKCNNFNNLKETVI